MDLVVVSCVALSGARTITEVTLASKAEAAAFAPAPVTVLDGSK